MPKHLKKVLSHLRRVFPKSKVILKLGVGFELYDDLKQNNLDLILSGPQGDDGIQLVTEALVWVGTDNYNQIDTSALNIIQMKAPCTYRKAAIDSLESSSFFWCEEVSVNNIQGILSAVEAGFGVSALPRSAVDDSLLILRDGLPELPDTSINLYWNKTNPHPLTKRCIELFKEEFKLMGL